MTTTLPPVDLLKATPSNDQPVIALSEGSDPRVVAGALAAVEAQLANVILVGPTAEVEATLEAVGGSVVGSGLSIHDPAVSELTDEFATAFYELRKHKGIDQDAARKAVKSPLVYAAMLVRCGHATGTVGGAVATTSDVLRTAIQVIGMAPDAAMVSSFFLMYPPESAENGRAMLYSDCGLVIDPSAQELAAIATASAQSCRTLLRSEPKIAMLSFSTMGSARHAAVDKVITATAALRAEQPDLCVDGEMQFDTAFVPSVGENKAPGSQVAGQANVMIFPNLDAGNIGYKLTQRLGGYAAIGPVLQGLAKPANDLSRGCSASDVTQMIAVTVLQSQGTSDGN
ncbi:phosphate acetyltransferase [Sedimentitalea sp. CY04]|uniref:Phosphate acetyltransferase n=1 Tax=Parasedimentitalea denitrificans TaxID=2211118 RepID=A0ABX0W614_9RHOB|nr:phosphate acetyltransferase [Sedimentitalea sp. CY04]NIZ61012.1 phosphate acetyltransferase [Sedimentitalea sp. CY04]